jgi:hypothetical protein
MRLRAMYPIIIVVVFFVGELTVGAKPNEGELSNQSAMVRRFMETFCRDEFNSKSGGEGIRQDTVRYTKKRHAEEKERDRIFEGKVVYLRSDPLYVVGSYWVKDVVIRRNGALVSVEYYRLARTEGHGDLSRQLIPDCFENEVVTYDLICQNNKWYILDPPLPRISPEAIVKDFRGTLQVMGDDWLIRPGLSEVQRQGYRKLQNDLEILESLRRQCQLK